jgi:hypothetical protein
MDFYSISHITVFINDHLNVKTSGVAENLAIAPLGLQQGVDNITFMRSSASAIVHQAGLPFFMY